MDVGFLNASVLSIRVSYDGNDLGNYIYKLGTLFYNCVLGANCSNGI